MSNPKKVLIFVLFTVVYAVVRKLRLIPDYCDVGYVLAALFWLEWFLRGYGAKR